MFKSIHNFFDNNFARKSTLDKTAESNKDLVAAVGTEMVELGEVVQGIYFGLNSDLNNLSLVIDKPGYSDVKHIVNSLKSRFMVLSDKHTVVDGYDTLSVPGTVLVGGGVGIVGVAIKFAAAANRVANAGKIVSGGSWITAVLAEMGGGSIATGGAGMIGGLTSGLVTFGVSTVVVAGVAGLYGLSRNQRSLEGLESHNQNLLELSAKIADKKNQVVEDSSKLSKEIVSLIKDINETEMGQDAINSKLISINILLTTLNETINK